MVIYIAVGYHVFRHRNRLRGAAMASLDKDVRLPSAHTSDAEDLVEEVTTLTRN